MIDIHPVGFKLFAGLHSNLFQGKCIASCVVFLGGDCCKFSPDVAETQL
jgi:hypothetical protein